MQLLFGRTRSVTLFNFGTILLNEKNRKNVRSTNKRIISNNLHARKHAKPRDAANMLSHLIVCYAMSKGALPEYQLEMKYNNMELRTQFVTNAGKE